MKTPTPFVVNKDTVRAPGIGKAPCAVGLRSRRHREAQRMTAHLSHHPAKTVQSILARDAIAELALDLSALAEMVADSAPRASLPRLEKAIHGLRAGVLMIGQTFREAELAELPGGSHG